MAASVKRTLRDINSVLGEINTTAKGAEKNVKELQDALQADPKNLQLQSTYLQSLNNQLSIYQKQLANVQASIGRLTPMADTSGTAADRIKNLEVQASLLKEQIQGVNDATNQAKTAFNTLNTTGETALKDINSETKNTATSLKTATTQTSSWESALSQVASMASSLISMRSIIQGITSVMTQAADTGYELLNNVKRYGGTVEDWQRQSQVWKEATNDADAYSNAIVSMQRVLGLVQKHAGEVGEALQKMGLVYADLEDKSPQEALQIVIQALQGIEDESTKAAVATALLEQNGVNLVAVSEMTAEEIANANEELERAGIITTAQAEKASAMRQQIDLLKQTISTFIVQIGTALLPLIQVAANFISSLSPLINSLATILNNIGTGGQVVLLMLAGLVAILPTLTTLFRAFNATLKANPILAIASAVLTLLNVFITLLSLLLNIDPDQYYEDRTANNAADAAQGSLSSYYNNQTTTTNNSYNVNVNKVTDFDNLMSQISRKQRSS